MIETSTRPSNQLELSIGDIVCNGNDITLDMGICVKTLKALSICKVTAIDDLRGQVSIVDTEALPGEPEFVCRNIRLELASLKDVKDKVAKIRFYRGFSIALYAAGAVAFICMMTFLGVFPYTVVVTVFGFYAGHNASRQFSRAEKTLYTMLTKGKL